MDIETIKQEPMAMVDLKTKLEEIKKKSGELNFRSAKVLEYLNQFVGKAKKKDADEIRKKLGGLDITRLKERHIIKIIDIMPNDADTLKAVFAGEATTLKPDDLKKILEIIGSSG